MEWYFKVVGSNYANFSGRATRKEYWMFSLFDIAIMIFLYLIDTSSVIYSIYILATIIPRYAVLVRRLHDINKSGWMILIGIIPLIGWIIIIIFTCLESYPEKNEYGENFESVKNQELIKNIAHLIKEDEIQDEKISNPKVPKIKTIPKTFDNELESINLTISSGKRSGSFYTVHSHTRIGRAPDNDIVFTENTVSSYHAEIKIKDNMFVIIDLNSTNGTKVDGNKIKEEIIKSGSTLRIGEINLVVE